MKSLFILIRSQGVFKKEKQKKENTNSTEMIPNRSKLMKTKRIHIMIFKSRESIAYSASYGVRVSNCQHPFPQPHALCVGINLPASFFPKTCVVNMRTLAWKFVCAI